MDKYKYVKCFEYVSERYYTNLLANLHTKIFLKVISILYTVITYFHPNFVDSEWYTDSFATTVDWRVSYRAETEKSVFPGCCADRARQVQVELEEQCESIHIQGSTWSGLSCPHVAQLLFLHITEKSNAEGRVQSQTALWVSSTAVPFTSWPWVSGASQCISLSVRFSIWKWAQYI